MSDLVLTAGTSPIDANKLPAGWTAKQLKNFCAFVQGGSLGLTKQNHYRLSGVAAFSAAGQDGYVDVTEFHNINAVVLSAIGANCGRCFLATGDWTTLANVQVVIPDATEVNARFLHYRVDRDDYWPRSGSAQPFIKPSDIKLCWVALPPVGQQVAIARVLDTLDTAIHETEAIIAKLKAVKQGLLHDLLTRGIDANGELRPPQTEAPQLYKESALGWIPKEWEIRRLEDCASIASGVTLGRSLQGHESMELPYLRVANVQDGYVDLSHVKKVRVLKGEVDRFALADGDVLMNEGGDYDKLGRGTVWRAQIHPCLHQNHVFRVRCDRDVLVPDYLAAYSASPRGKTFFILASKQSTNLASINSTQLKGFPVACPGADEQVEIVGMLQGADRLVRSETNQLSKLHALKAGLMDDLLTGRVRVTPLLEDAAP